jgi:hypothetical protein
LASEAIPSTPKDPQNGVVPIKVCVPSGREMNKNQDTNPTVNLSPLMALSALTLLGTIAGVVMLWGLHNKIPKQASSSDGSTISADEIGKIELDQNLVRFNLMKRGENGKLSKMQAVELPLEKFASGYPRIKSFMDQMIEKGIITEQ